MEIDVNKCSNKRMKNGELVLAVARFIMQDKSASVEVISHRFSVSPQAVNGALNKIRKKLEAGLAIPGICETEVELLRQSMAERDGGHISPEIKKMIREMFVEGMKVRQIALTAGLSKEKIKKALLDMGYKKIRIVKVYIDTRGQNAIRRVSTIKPLKTRSIKKAVKRESKISRSALANWCRLHYDDSGSLKLPAGCVAPADLPMRYPRTKELVLLAAESKTLYSAPPPAECTTKGKKRIGYMRFF